MPIVTFKKAERKGARILLSAYSMSGGGKTLSLLKIGRGLVGPRGKLGMIDTENGRGLIYANQAGGYEYAELSPPFTPERYAEAIRDAENAGIEALVLDSASHVWEGIGGILEIADQQKSRSGLPLEGLVKWSKPKARYKKYVNTLLNSRMHLLISLRAKEKFVQRKGDNGREEIVSAGFVEIQDSRFIYEMTVQLFFPVYEDRNKRGVPVVEKCPEDLIGAFPPDERVSEETGRRIAAWINSGAPVDNAFERIKVEAEERAGDGKAALAGFWNNLQEGERARLNKANLDSIAASADAETAERELQSGDNAFAELDAEPESEAVKAFRQAAQGGWEALKAHYSSMKDRLSDADFDVVNRMLGSSTEPGELRRAAREADRNRAAGANGNAAPPPPRPELGSLDEQDIPF